MTDAIRSEVAVEIKSSTLLKPWPPSAAPVLGAMLPLTFFDLTAARFHFRFLLAFRAPTPDDEHLRRSLSEALAHFPILAGRLDRNDAGNLSVALNDDGARLIEARASVALADMGDDELRRLLPTCGAGVEELLVLQLSRLRCGGLAVGIAFHHRVADAHSIAIFLSAWAKISRGSRDGIPLPSVCFQRAALISPRDPPSVSFEHLGTDFLSPAPAAQLGSPSQPPARPVAAESVTFDFSSDFISKLKASVPGVGLTRFECLFAHIWKEMTVARAVDDNETSEVMLAVNGRKKMSPPLPDEFFGNMVVFARPKLRAGDLKHGDLATAARAVHEAIAKIDDSFVRSMIDFGKEMEGREDELLLNTGRPGSSDVVVSSWLGFGMEEIDLGAGGGTPVALLLPGLSFDGFVFLLPSCRVKGGVVAHVSMCPHGASALKETMKTRCHLG